MISQNALREAAKIMHRHLGDLDDLPIELVNTLANIYYRFFAYKDHMLSGGRSLFLDPYVPQSSNLLDAYKNNNKFFAEVSSTFECAKGIVLSARQACAENPKLFSYLVTFMLDVFKYNIENAESKTPIRRAIERKFKKVREIQNLFEIMQKARLHDDALYQQARVVFDKGYRTSSWNAADNPALSSAFTIFQQLADQDYGKSYYPLSCLFRTGQDDIDKNQLHFQHYAQLAFDWCFANQANLDAELWCDLGEMYLSGFGVEKNNEQAVYWFRKAAEQGNANGQRELGNMYFDGCGVEQGLEQARGWYYKAAVQGDSKGQYRLGLVFDLAKRYEDAVHMYRLAAENGDPLAQKSLREMYEKGRGIERDHDQAVYWDRKYSEQFRKPAERGNAVAQLNLGLMYARASDDKEAMKWYRLAADQGNAKAQVMIGDMYFHGWGVVQDDAQAEHWYLMAAKQGSMAGKRGLGNLYPTDYPGASFVDDLIAQHTVKTNDG